MHASIIHACIHICTHACMHTYVHACVRACVRTYVRAYVRTYMHVSWFTPVAWLTAGTPWYTPASHQIYASPYVTEKINFINYVINSGSIFAIVCTTCVVESKTAYRSSIIGGVVFWPFVSHIPCHTWVHSDMFIYVTYSLMHVVHMSGWGYVGG